MREELVEELKNLAKLDVPMQEVYGGARITTTSAEFIDGIQELAQEAADAIENTSKAYQMMAEAYEAEVAKRGWISVMVRLPEAGERVLCYCRANIYEVMKMRTDGDWVYDTNHVYMHSFVTHWMPLPTPPKENEE